MKNKKILFIILTIILVCIIIAVFYMIKNISNNKIKKGNNLFGNEYCNGHSSEMGLTVMTNYTCKICGAKKEAGSAPAPLICNKCSKLTNRCNRCGKLFKAN